MTSIPTAISFLMTWERLGHGHVLMAEMSFEMAFDNYPGSVESQLDNCFFFANLPGSSEGILSTSSFYFLLRNGLKS